MVFLCQKMLSEIFKRRHAEHLHDPTVCQAGLSVILGRSAIHLGP